MVTKVPRKGYKGRDKQCWRGIPNGVNPPSGLDVSSWSNANLAGVVIVPGGAPGGVNPAYAITDSSAIAHELRTLQVAVPVDTADHYLELYMKKSETAPGGGFNFGVQGGTPITGFARVNQDGTPMLSAFTTITEFNDWWKLNCLITNNGTNNLLVLSLYPATRPYGSVVDNVSTLGTNYFAGVRYDY